MSWDPIKEPCDYIVLAGKKSPGLAEIEGAGSPRKWDERKGYGLSGSTIVYRGAELAKFSVKIRLYTSEDWSDWEAWRPLVDSPPLGTRARSLDIQHPLLTQLAIHSVVVQDVSQPVQTDDGEWTIDIKMIQFRQPKFALAKPEGSTATPVDPVEQHIQKLTDQFQDLANQ